MSRGFSRRGSDNGYVQPIGDWEDRTQQNFKGECDVNRIMRKWSQTGVVPPQIAAESATFGDFSSVPTFLEAMTAVHEAVDAFDSLPAKVRELCSGRPDKFLEMVYDIEGREALCKAGLTEERIAEVVPKSSELEVVKEPEKAPAESGTTYNETKWSQ